VYDPEIGEAISTNFINKDRSITKSVAKDKKMAHLPV
jgi:hypothetical protein